MGQIIFRGSISPRVPLIQTPTEIRRALKPFYGAQSRIVIASTPYPQGGSKPEALPEGSSLLKGSWDLVSKVISRVIIRITPLRGLITPIISYLLRPMIL